MHEPPRPGAGGRGTDPGSRPPAFGPIDPYCWLPVGALLVMAVLFVFGGSVPIAAGFAAVAVLVALFDARVNRPAPSRRFDSGRDYARSAAPQQAPRQAPRPAMQRPVRAARSAPPIGQPPRAGRPLPGLSRPHSTPAVQPDSAR